MFQILYSASLRFQTKQHLTIFNGVLVAWSAAALYFSHLDGELLDCMTASLFTIILNFDARSQKRISRKKVRVRPTIIRNGQRAIKVELWTVNSEINFSKTVNTCQHLNISSTHSTRSVLRKPFVCTNEK